jgi:hypothetical protein
MEQRQTLKYARCDQVLEPWNPRILKPTAPIELEKSLFYKPGEGLKIFFASDEEGVIMTRSLDREKIPGGP